MTTLETRLAFATPVAETRLPDAAALNARLVALLRGLQASEPGMQARTTVRRGWQSPPTLLGSTHPDMLLLKRLLADPVEEYVCALARINQTADPPVLPRYDYRGWAVIVSSGGFQDQHVHSRADVVGVYCVATGAGDAQPGRGDLVLIDPRPGRQATQPAWETGILRVRPEPGKLVLFPAYVPHRVDLYERDEDRITINFDITLTGPRTA